MEKFGRGWIHYALRDQKLLLGRFAYRGVRWMDVTEWSHIPNSPCCYVIQDEGVTVYVGQTMRLKDRLASHRARGGVLHRIENARIRVHFGVRFGDWAMREARLIRRLQPRMNIRGIT